jgi:hypothetical protein
VPVLGAQQDGIPVPIPLAKLISLVAEHCKVGEEELFWPSKQPAIVRAKALICFIATRLCRDKAYSTTAVSRAALRGKIRYEEDDVLREYWMGKGKEPPHFRGSSPFPAIPTTASLRSGRWSTLLRNGWPSLTRNQWPTFTGIRTETPFKGADRNYQQLPQPLKGLKIR